ncbi:MAG: serine protease [Woeseiaceae bacterium]|nr:serine protease [Woeseiaceae bacterium]
MPRDRLSSAVVCIRSTQGEIWGAGVYIGSKRHNDESTSWYVLTCAHVVADAMGANSAEREALQHAENAPDGRIVIDFPVIDPAFRIEAKVLPENWVPAIRSGEAGASVRDIAILTLAKAPPDGAAPIPTTARRDRGDYFKAYGFPVEADRGTYAEGRIQGPVAYGDLEIHASGDSPNDTFVKEGFSGTPAWHTEQQAMFGMVAEVLGRSRAYVRPLEILKEVLPEMDDVDPEIEVPPPVSPSVQPIRLPKKIPYSRLHSVDRTEQKENLRGFIGDQITVETFKPWLFLLRGSIDENPTELVQHISDEILSRYDIKSGATSWDDFPWVPWSDPKTGIVDARIQEIMTNLSGALAAGNPDVSDIRKSLEDPTNINVVAWEIAASTIDAAESDLLERWFQMWNAIAAGGLRRPVAVFLCFVYYEEDALGARSTDDIWGRSDWPTYSEITVHPLEEITSFSVQRVESWCNKILPQAGVQRRNLPKATEWIKGAMPGDRVTWTEFFTALEKLKVVADDA